MQLTKGGWRRGEHHGRRFRGLVVIVGEGKVVRPSQLIRGVRPTMGEQHEEAPRAWPRRAV